MKRWRQMDEMRARIAPGRGARQVARHAKASDALPHQTAPDAALMRLAVLGAGAVGPAAAVLAVSRGHTASLWSPRGGGTHGIGGHLRSTGLLEGMAQVTVAVDVARALAGADAVLVAVPAHALGPVLRRIAPLLPAGVPVLLAPSHSLAPLMLARLLAQRDIVLPIGAMAAPPLVAQRIGPEAVRIQALAARTDLAAVPAEAAPGLAQMAASLFGVPFRPVPSLLSVLLAAHEPVRQAALALGNLTRIERAEAWDIHAQMTPALARLMQRLDAERLALAAACGIAVPTLAEALAAAHGLPPASLDSLARALAAQGPAPGPMGLDAAHLAESVTYGLALWQRVAAHRGVAMPLTAAAIAVLQALWGTTLTGDDLAQDADITALA